MSIHTFILNDKTLGFTLDKKSNCPILDKITPGGSLEKELINSCSTITSGCLVQSIGDEDISNMPYDKAVDKIKSWTERPVKISIISPNNSPKVIRESYVTTNDSFKMTVEEMNKQSEIATKNALRDLAKSQKNNNNLSSSDDDDDFSDFKKMIPYIKYKELENKMHILRMELLNSQVDNDELKSDLNKQINPLKSINDELCHINTLSIRNNNIKNMNSNNMELYLSKVNHEFRDYIASIEKYMKLIELHEIKNSIIYKLNKEKDNFQNFNNKFQYKIKIKVMFEFIQAASLLILSISILGFILYYNNYKPSIKYFT